MFGKLFDTLFSKSQKLLFLHKIQKEENKLSKKVIYKNQETKPKKKSKLYL